jgi:predicted nucleic acid-binding protein
MQSFVTDSMALIRHIEGRNLGVKAKKIFAETESQKSIIYIPAMVMAEIMYLGESKRITISLLNAIEYIKRFPHYKEYHLTTEVLKASSEIKDIPELHDRLIAGTARELNLPLITNDPKIIASQFIKTIW